MWSFADPIWETVFKWATISALAFGGVGIASAFVSAWVGYQITDATQKEANRQIADAHVRSEEARADAARATEAAGRANERAATASERAAALEKEAAQAKLEQEKLKTLLAWRRLNDKQSRTIIAGLAGVQLNLRLTAIASDPESMLFATDIRNALRAAGFNLDIQSEALFGTGPIVGLIISGPKSDVIRVATPFAEAGLHIHGEERPGDVEILVGSKPPPSN